MGWLWDILKELPLSTVLKERVALAEQKGKDAVEEAQKLRQKIVDLEAENTKLRAQLPPKSAGHISNDTHRVLIYLFRAERKDSDVGTLAVYLQMERGVAQHHLDLLIERGMALYSGSDYITGQPYCSLTSNGRRYVVENGLLSE